MSKGRVRMHKELMRRNVSFKKGTSINLFAAVLKRVNQLKESSCLEFHKKELREIGFRSLHYVEAEECSIFETEKTEAGIRIHLKEEAENLLFTGGELAAITKGKASRNMDLQLKKKSKELMLFNMPELYHINGRYPKHLYLILSCFQKSGFYINTLERFREIIGIPERYTPYDIKKILNSCAEELKKKSSIKIKSIKIEGEGGNKMLKINFDNYIDYENLTEEQVKMAEKIAFENGINIAHILKKPNSLMFKMTMKDLLTNNFEKKKQ